MWFSIPYVPDFTGMSSTAYTESASSACSSVSAPALAPALTTSQAQGQIQAPQAPRSSFASVASLDLARDDQQSMWAVKPTSSPASHINNTLSRSTDDTINEHYVTASFGRDTFHFSNKVIEEERGEEEEEEEVFQPANKTEERIHKSLLTAIVVDDTILVRKLMKKVLKKMGFARVWCYENGGSKGLDAMMKNQVDIVFSDVQMPIMSGPEMIKRFRVFEEKALETHDRTRRQVVVAVTANGDQTQNVGKSGFDDMCPKPLRQADICHIVELHLKHVLDEACVDQTNTTIEKELSTDPFAGDDAGTAAVLIDHCNDSGNETGTGAWAISRAE